MFSVLFNPILICFIDRWLNYSALNDLKAMDGKNLLTNVSLDFFLLQAVFLTVRHKVQSIMKSDFHSTCNEISDVISLCFNNNKSKPPNLQHLYLKILFHNISAMWGQVMHETTVVNIFIYLGFIYWMWSLQDICRAVVVLYHTSLLKLLCVGDKVTNKFTIE